MSDLSCPWSDKDGGSLWFNNLKKFCPNLNLAGTVVAGNDETAVRYISSVLRLYFFIRASADV